MTIRSQIRLQGWAVIVGWLVMIFWGIWTSAGVASSIESSITTNTESTRANREAIESMRQWREKFVPQYQSDMATIKADVRWLCLQRDPNYSTQPPAGEQP